MHWMRQTAVHRFGSCSQFWFWFWFWCTCDDSQTKFVVVVVVDVSVVVVDMAIVIVVVVVTVVVVVVVVTAVVVDVVTGAIVDVVVVDVVTGAIVDVVVVVVVCPTKIANIIPSFDPLVAGDANEEVRQQDRADECQSYVLLQTAMPQESSRHSLLLADRREVQIQIAQVPGAHCWMHHGLVRDRDWSITRYFKSDDTFNRLLIL